MKEFPDYIQRIDGQFWLIEDERDNLKLSYRLKDIIFSENSPFQHVMIVDSYDFGRMLVLDGIVQTTSIDGYIYNEMISHVPLSLHPRPEKVLIIGGGDCGAAREVAKYESVKSIDLVEIDELVVKVCKQYLQEVSGNLSDPRVNFIYNDGVAFVKECKNYYDVVIVDSSDPIGPARQLFELSFCRDIHNVLKEDGIMVCQSQSPIFHFEILKQTYERIKSLFSMTKIYTSVVPTYPGGLWSFTLASKVHRNIVIGEFDRNTKYVNKELIERCFSLPEFIKVKLNIK